MVSFGAATSNVVFSQLMLTNANAYSEFHRRKMNHYLSSEKHSIDEDAADVDDSGVIDKVDFYSMREKIIALDNRA